MTVQFQRSVPRVWQTTPKPSTNHTPMQPRRNSAQALTVLALLGAGMALVLPTEESQFPEISHVVAAQRNVKSPFSLTAWRDIQQFAGAAEADAADVQEQSRFVRLGTAPAVAQYFAELAPQSPHRNEVATERPEGEAAVVLTVAPPSHAAPSDDASAETAIAMGEGMPPPTEFSHHKLSVIAGHVTHLPELPRIVSILMEAPDRTISASQSAPQEPLERATLVFQPLLALSPLAQSDPAAMLPARKPAAAPTEKVAPVKVVAKPASAPLKKPEAKPEAVAAPATKPPAVAQSKPSESAQASFGSLGLSAP